MSSLKKFRANKGVDLVALAKASMEKKPRIGNTIELPNVLKVWTNKTNTFGKLLGSDNRKAFENAYIHLGIKGDKIVLEVLPEVIMTNVMLTKGKSLTKKNVKDETIKNVASSVGISLSPDGKFTVGTYSANLCAIYGMKLSDFDGLGVEFTLTETTVNEEFRNGEPAIKKDTGKFDKNGKAIITTRYPKSTYTLKAFELSLKGVSTIEDDDVAGSVKA